MFNTVIGVLLIIMAVFLVISVLMQSSKDHRLSGSIAGGAETFFGKTKGKTLDALFNKLTTIIAIVFVVLVLVLYCTQDNFKKDEPANENAVVSQEKGNDDSSANKPEANKPETDTPDTIDTPDTVTPDSDTPDADVPDVDNSDVAPNPGANGEDVDGGDIDGDDVDGGNVNNGESDSNEQ